MITSKHQQLLLPTELALLCLPDQRRKQQPLVNVCVHMCVSPSQQMLCQHTLSPRGVRVSWVCGVVEAWGSKEGVHAACLKNSTSGAVLGVWDDVLQAQSLSSLKPECIQTNHVLITDPPVCASTCLLSACIQQMCLLPMKIDIFTSGRRGLVRLWKEGVSKFHLLRSTKQRALGGI